MFCEACGNRHRPEAKFCNCCGAELVQHEEDDERTQELPAPPYRGTWVPKPLQHALADKYEVTRVLGRGGMGTVYLAHERALDRQVALKVLQRGSGDDDRAVERFLQEARLAARLRHPNIVSVHSVGERRDFYYFTMDYIEGETTATLVAEHHPRGMAPGAAMALFTEIAKAVRHAHENGVVHRDLKPGNIMVDRADHVLVLDFGLAKAQTASGLSTSGIVVGTPQYISPEHIQGKPATGLSDIYALGLILYFFLTGEHLVHGESIPAVVMQHLSGTPATRARDSPRLDRELARFISRMVQRDPTKRPENLTRVLEEAARLSWSAPTAPIPVMPEPARSTPAVSTRRAQAELADTDALLVEGDHCFRLGAYDDALRAFSRAGSRGTRSERAWLGQLLCLVSLGQLDDAAVWSGKALEMFPESADLAAVRSLVLGRLGHPEAEPLSEASLERGGDHGLVWWARGDLLLLSDPDSAIESFDRALSLSPGDPELLLWVGKSLLDGGRFRDALKVLAAANELDPDHPMIWYHLGVVQRELASFQEAQTSFERAMELSPQNPEARLARRELDSIGWLKRRLKKIRVRLKPETEDGD